MFYKRYQSKCKPVCAPFMSDDPGSRTISPLADIAGCVRFFSRLPIPPLGANDNPAHMPDFRCSAWALPIAGLIIALPALLLVTGLHVAQAPAAVAAFLFVGLLVLCSGGLHEDGLADMADGFGGGMSRERKLSIMKDSRIGAYGVLALILVTGLKIAAITALYSNVSAPLFLAQLVLAILASRLVMLVLWHALKHARSDGLAVMAGRPERRALELAGGLVLIALILTASLVGGKSIVGLIAMAVLITVWIGSMAMRHIGGQTGDVLGASQQIAEAAILTTFTLTAT